MPDGTRTGAVLLRLAGPLDADTCGHLRYQLAAAFAAGVTSVVVDMSEVSSIDVAGLGVLTGAAKHLQRREGEPVLAHPSPPRRCSPPCASTTSSGCWLSVRRPRCR